MFQNQWQMGNFEKKNTPSQPRKTGGGGAVKIELQKSCF